MHTLAFVNQKGGCGKTTTAVHLGGALADTGERVLLVDLDPQAHATMALGCAVDGEPTVADVLMHRTPLWQCVRSHGDAGGSRPGIALLPSEERLAEFEDIAERMLQPERVLHAALAAEPDAYDFVLIDCPPRADGVLTANALRAADTAVLVVETGAFALQGSVKALRLLEEMAAEMETSFDLRVVSTLFDERHALPREILIGTQARFDGLLFDTVIRESVRLREAAAFGVAVQELDRECRASRDFAALAGEVRALARERALAPLRSPRRPPRPRRSTWTA